jgi:Resolvase, N terminal domain
MFLRGEAIPSLPARINARRAPSPRAWVLAHHLEDVGVDLYLGQQSIDTTRPTGKLVFQVTGAFAEFERAMVRQRVRAREPEARRGAGRAAWTAPASSRSPGRWVRRGDFSGSRQNWQGRQIGADSGGAGIQVLSSKLAPPASLSSTRPYVEREPGQKIRLSVS